MAMPVIPVVGDDIHCRRCGYNLRSMEATGTCPECALPVALSLKSELMADANPAWLRILIFGLWIIAAGTLLGRLLYWSGRLFPGPPSAAYHVFYLSIRLIILLGYWKLTTIDPSGIEGAGARRTRNCLRWIVVAATIINILEVATYRFMGIGATTTLTVYFVSAAISYPYILYEYAYLMALVNRIPASRCVGMLKWLRLLSLLGLFISSSTTLFLMWEFSRSTAATQFSRAMWTTYQGANCYSTLVVFIYVAVLLWIIALLRRARNSALRAWQAAVDSVGGTQVHHP